MMAHTDIKRILAEWLQVLGRLGGLDVGPWMQSDQRRSRMNQRQKVFDELQSFDEKIAEIASLRRQGWPGCDPLEAQELEKRYAIGLSTLETICLRDTQSLVTMKELRTATLEKMGYGTKGRSPLFHVRHATPGPARIVDDHF